MVLSTLAAIAQLARSRSRRSREDMTTKLEKPLKREILIEGRPYVLTISPDGFKLVEKGRRKGQELSWKDVVSGQAALATALNASLEQAP
jgi:hypothetical protein